MYIVNGRAYFGKCPKVICSLGVDIEPIRDMQKEAHLLETCDWNNTYRPLNKIYHQEFWCLPRAIYCHLGIGWSWGGGSCYMWNFFIEVLLLCAPPFLIPCPVLRKYNIVFD
jgi:hypothetical protein